MVGVIHLRRLWGVCSGKKNKKSGQWGSFRPPAKYRGKKTFLYSVV